MVNALIVLIILLFSLIGLKKVSKQKPNYIEEYGVYKTEDVKEELTYEQYMTQLDWMFKMGIISVQEYEQYKRDGGIFLIN
jgi:hypothetical protein